MVITDSGLSSGAMIGIIAGGGALLLVIIGLLGFFIWNKKRQNAVNVMNSIQNSLDTSGNTKNVKYEKFKGKIND